MGRSTATVLFTDLVGSTELSVRFRDRYDEARRAHDALLRSAIEGQGGVLVKGLGDGVMATFDAVGDGVAAARAIQQAIHRLNGQGREPALSVRVGLSVGDVTFEDGDCFGEAVVEAARVCGEAEGDQILATRVVGDLAGGPRAEGFESLGSLVLKGLPDPVDIVAVHWDRSVASTTPLPARLAVQLAAFVGRARELDRLHEAFDKVANGTGQRVVLVGGEPGVGKTTMVGQAVRAWHERGATVAMGRCEEDVRAPYRPFVDVLTHLVDSAPLEVLQAHVERHGAVLDPLVPRLGQRLPALPEPVTTDPETERFLRFAAVADLLAALGEQAPVVVFLDDLHWADAGTASLLRHLATVAESSRLLITGTFRSDELAADHPMGTVLAAFRRVESVSRLQLGGLRGPDVVALLELWTGVEAGDGTRELAERIATETGGNAFFVTEVVRHLEEAGQLSDLAGAVAAEGSLLPDSVREVLGERVARIGSPADTVLGAAAVIGAEFDLPVLSAVTGMAEEKLLDVLAQASSAALVHESIASPGRFSFTHALVQHAILLLLGPTRTAAMHRRVAEAMEAEVGAGTLDALAHHWLQATSVPDTGRARDWAVQAGDAAMTALAPGDALAYYRQALLLHDRVTDDEGTRIDLLTKLGTAERQAGDPEHRDTLLKACRLAQRLGDVERLAEAALANHSGTFSRFQGTDPDRLQMLEAAIAAGGGSVGQRARLLATLANELTYAGDFDRRRQLADDALRAARADGDPALLLQVANSVFYALWIPDTLDERLELTAESLALRTEVDDPLALYWSAMSGYMNLVQAGRVAEAEPLLRDLLTITDRLAQPALRWRAVHTHATRMLLAGDPDAAEPLAIEALELGDQAGEPEAAVYFKSQQLCIHWQRGTLHELATRIRGESSRPANARASLAVIFAEGGRQADANTILDDIATNGLAELDRDPAFVAAVALFAEAAISLQHTGSASILYPLLLPHAKQVGFDGVATVGCLQHHVGGLAHLLGRRDEAVERLEESCRIHQEIEAPFFEARSRLVLATVQDAGGPADRQSAGRHLAAAAAIAETNRYRAVARSAHERLAQMDGG